MLEGLLAITRSFDMNPQPHLLLLQKTMVMVEGVAAALDPDINMWETSAPMVAGWMRDELGPEARLANMLKDGVRLLKRLPDLLERIEDAYPKKGAAPPGPPLPEIAVWRPSFWWVGYIAATVLAAGLIWLLYR
ncbi:MAG: ubiquinone biosynthesis protein UbiB, partial [Alphaproteobacteria bacterium]|nr:ubiquinone biosynthesis protein UbiB [Alphaproteobacteria bacterium]